MTSQRSRRSVSLREKNLRYGQFRRSGLSYELVDAALLGQSGIDVAARVDTHAMDMAALEAGEHVTFGIAHADIGGLAIVFLLGDVVVAVLAAGAVLGAAHAGPLAE